MSEVMNVAVLCGGPSPEAKVSRKSGRAVARALERRGHKVALVESDRAGILSLANADYDCCWLALHGPYGEDGTVQGFLETIGLPYTGSGVAASAVAMDKLLTRQLLRTAGFKQPKWLTVNLTGCDSFVLPEDWSFPVFIKPNIGGSSLGTTLVKSASGLQEALYKALAYADVVLVEQCLKGRELGVGVFEGAPLGDIEIIPNREYYDFEAKYEDDNGTVYVVAPELPPEVRAELHREALEACQLLNCEGAVRIDFFLVGSNDIYFMEVNTIPGMTETSLLPKIAAQAGIVFEELVERMAWQARLKCV